MFSTKWEMSWNTRLQEPEEILEISSLLISTIGLLNAYWIPYHLARVNSEVTS